MSMAGPQGEPGPRGAPGTAGLRGPRGDDGGDVVRERDTIRVVTSALLAAMVLAVVGLSIYLVTYVQGQREQVDCFRRAFNDTNSALATTIGASGRDRRSLLALVTSLTNPALNAAQRAAALEDYKRQLAAGEQQRASNPLPDRTC